MAVWPGKDPESHPDGNRWKHTLRTTMPAPCHTNLKMTITRDTLEYAMRDARTQLNRVVRRHLATCKKCPPNV